MSASADDQYEQQNDQVSGDAPAGDAQDNDYTSRTGQKQAPIPVQSDNDNVEDPIDPNTADSDQQLGMFGTRSSHQYWRVFILTLYNREGRCRRH